MRARTLVVAGLVAIAGGVWWRHRAAAPVAEIGLAGGVVRKLTADDPGAAELLAAAASARRALEGEA